MTHPVLVNGVRVGPASPLLTAAGAKRRLAPGEADDQKALMELLLGKFWHKGGSRRPGLGMTEKYPELLLLYAINPNKGGQGSKAARGMAKAMGLLPDIMDLCLPVMRGPFLTLYVELKRAGNYGSPSQRALAETLRAEGHCVIECQGVEESSAVILGYLALPKNRPSVRPLGGSGPIDEQLAVWRRVTSDILTPNRK